MRDNSDFAAMTPDEVIGHLRATLAANPGANSVTLTLDRATGKYRLVIA